MSTDIDIAAILQRTQELAAERQQIDVAAEVDRERREAEGRDLDVLGQSDELDELGGRRTYAKVGSARPTSLLYTNGPGAIIDLPQLTAMPACFDDWEYVWTRFGSKPPEIHAPRLRKAIRTLMRAPDLQLRPYPWRPRPGFMSREGSELGVPGRIFPQWYRCTGCSWLTSIRDLAYTNDQRYRPDQARFEHKDCFRPGAKAKTTSSAVPARYLLACVDGHLDEFPYDQWVHRWEPCEKADLPHLRMLEGTLGRGASATIKCDNCGKRRPMSQAQGEAGRSKLPPCRGRHPHLDDFKECDKETHLMVVGASNLWFAVTESVIVMPDHPQETTEQLAERIQAALGIKIAQYADNIELARDLLAAKDAALGEKIAPLSEAELRELMVFDLAVAKTAEEERQAIEDWDPVELLLPEWQYLLRPVHGTEGEDERYGLSVQPVERHPNLRSEVAGVLAVHKLCKVNALAGFTRIDDADRAGDLADRLVPLSRFRPTWTVATRDHGEGVFLWLDEDKVAAWEQRILQERIWEAHVAAHAQNFRNRFSKTAAEVPHGSRLKPPRYWLVHTFAHVLIRQMAMECGYSAASLTERLYAWEGTESREPAAGLLICTTASDSDGTLGGLVQLCGAERLEALVERALYRAARCSSDPVCAMRTPQHPEDFLHGAACHCCAMASETSCERANRFLDRRFLLDLPGSSLGFFGPPRA